MDEWDEVADDLLITAMADQAIRAADCANSGRSRNFGIGVIVVVGFLDPLHFEVEEVQDVGRHCVGTGKDGDCEGRCTATASCKLESIFRIASTIDSV